MKKGRKDKPYPPTTTTQLDISTPDLIRGIFGDSEEDSSASSKKLRSGGDVSSANLLDYAAAAATPASPPWSVTATPAPPATPSASWSVAPTTPASTPGLEAEEDAEARAFLGKGYEDIREKMAAKANERLVSSPAIPNPNKQNAPLYCMVYIGEDSMGPNHMLFSKSAAWNSRCILGEHINYVSEGYNPASSEQFDQESKLWSVMGSDKDGFRCITIVSVSDMPGDTNADMPEFRKYMQLTIILAKQISQLEDHDDDVALLPLPQIYSLIEEERRLHTYNDI